LRGKTLLTRSQARGGRHGTPARAGGGFVHALLCAVVTAKPRMDAVKVYRAYDKLNRGVCVNVRNLAASAAYNA